MLRIASVQMTVPVAQSRPVQPVVHHHQPQDASASRPAKEHADTSDMPRTGRITDAAFATIAGLQTVLPPQFVPAFQPLFADPLPNLPTLAPADNPDGGTPPSSPAASVHIG